MYQVLQEGIRIGKDNKVIKKTVQRMATAFKKLGKHNEGKTIHEETLAEHRMPQNKKAEVVSTLKVSGDVMYKDAALAEVEKTNGNQRFKASDFEGATKHYTEAIRRNPMDSQILLNRAVCYCRLLSFELALMDLEHCIQLDKNFLKAHIRKGKVLQAMGIYNQAKHVFEEALKLNPSSDEALEGQRQCSQLLTGKSPLEDPEVKQIMEDSNMQEVLKQIQKKPNCIVEHMQNPDIANKINKLNEVGIVKVMYGLTRRHLDVSQRPI